MSIADKIALLEQQGQLAIWKKTSSPKDIRAVRSGIAEYLCEKMKKGIDAKAARANNHPNQLKKGLDYLTKEDSGRMRAFGFLREDVMRLTGQIPHKMDNEHLVAACLQVWETRLSRKDIDRVAHKYVLSLYPELCEVMAKTGHSADELLMSSVSELLRRYRDKYYPGQKIGYLVGVHHDKAHIHAHVMLFATTESGKLLRVSDEGEERGSRKPFKFMVKLAPKIVDRFFRREIKSQSPASVRSPSRFAQSKLLAFAVKARMHKNLTLSNLPEAEQQLWQHTHYESLLSEDQDALRKALKEGYESQERFFQTLMDIRNEEPQPFEDYRDAARNERAKQAREMKRLHEEKARLRERMGQLRTGKQVLFDDLGKWRRYRFPRGSLGEGGNDLRDSEVADWLVQTMARSDKFGTLVRQYVEEKQALDERIELPKQFLRAMAGAQNPVAAEKFTQKDTFARQCIEHSAGRIVGPAFSMLDRYYRQDVKLSKHIQKDFVREFLQGAIDMHREELKSMGEQKLEIQRKMDALRIEQAASKIKEDVIHAAMRGRKPAFLEEFDHWRETGREIPLDGLEIIKKGRDNKYQTELRQERSNDFNQRMTLILQKIRENHMRLDTRGITIKGGVAPAPPSQDLPFQDETDQEIALPLNKHLEPIEEADRVKLGDDRSEIGGKVSEIDPEPENRPNDGFEMYR
ncbi:MAG: hypothetical protein GVY36_10090 [Verrucomicrobia bacterium]|jgi:hypothetical protein|nr:hypothetical protein [Verrucomicrobiota bacterium]